MNGAWCIGQAECSGLLVENTDSVFCGIVRHMYEFQEVIDLWNCDCSVIECLTGVFVYLDPYSGEFLHTAVYGKMYVGERV